MKKAVTETGRRRSIQKKYNKEHGIVPKTIKREIQENIFGIPFKKPKLSIAKMSKSTSREKLKEELEEEMYTAARDLNFEKAAELRDLIKTIK